ncbi:MAG: hypothetical protein V5A34_03955 [Halapricum sp.]
MKTLTKSGFEDLIDDLIASDLRPVVGPRRADERDVFDELDSVTQPELEYDLTIRETGRVTHLVQCNGGQVQ